MADGISIFLLWLFVINLGIAFGAGVYEHRIALPRWIATDAAGTHWNPDAVRRDNSGLRFWAYATTGPLTLLTLANLVAAWVTGGTLGRWWLAAALLALVDRVLTFGYFIPTMVGLMASVDSPSAVRTARRWVALNHLRHVLVLASWLAALQAFFML